jgi:Fe-only nitrogenase accessory protein AnfO
MKIAVFVDEDGSVLPFMASGVVEIYADDSGEWICINQIPFDVIDALGISDIRTRTRMLVSEFEDCELLVIESIKGISKVVLEEFKIGSWQFKGVLIAPLLNKIKVELEKVKEQQAKLVVTPVLVGEAVDASYEIDLASILGNERSLNSRDILVPFMQKTFFRKLTIVCSHLPKWFEPTAALLELEYELTETDDGQVLAVVKPTDFEAGLTIRQHISAGVLNSVGGCSSGCCSSGVC